MKPESVSPEIVVRSKDELLAAVANLDYQTHTVIRCGGTTYSIPPQLKLERFKGWTYNKRGVLTRTDQSIHRSKPLLPHDAIQVRRNRLIQAIRRTPKHAFLINEKD